MYIFVWIFRYVEIPVRRHSQLPTTFIPSTRGTVVSYKVVWEL